MKSFKSENKSNFLTVFLTFFIIPLQGYLIKPVQPPFNKKFLFSIVDTKCFAIDTFIIQQKIVVVNTFFEIF